MRRKSLLLAALLPLAPSVAAAYGEGDGDRPGLEERAVHFYTDQLRVDPDAADDPACGDPPDEALVPVDPLVYQGDLNDAARFFAEDMQDNGCFPADHSSCDGTSFEDRVRGFYDGPMIGENIAMMQADPLDVVTGEYGWLKSYGHCVNIFRGSFDELGTGFAGTVGTSSTWWVQDFGGRGGVPIPIVPSATHEPLYPAAGASLAFRATVHDEAGQPASVHAMAGGICYEMEPDRGGDVSRTWAAAAVAGATGCLEWTVSVLRADGSRVTYPDTGSLLVPVGGAECAIWTEHRFESECTPGTGEGMAGDGLGCGAPGGDPDANVGEDAEYGSCAMAPGPRGFAGLLALATGALATRRRRQVRATSAGEGAVACPPPASTLQPPASRR